MDGRDVVDRLVPLVYGQLRHLAHAYLARERHAQTLLTTELVHEAYLKLWITRTCRSEAGAISSEPPRERCARSWWIGHVTAPG